MYAAGSGHHHYGCVSATHALRGGEGVNRPPISVGVRSHFLLGAVGRYEAGMYAYLADDLSRDAYTDWPLLRQSQWGVWSVVGVPDT